MNQIKITIKEKTYKYNLDFEPQLAPSGRLFRYSGLKKNLQLPEKYVKGVYKNHWIYTFIFLDNSEFIHFEFDYFDIFVGIVK